MFSLSHMLIQECLAHYLTNLAIANLYAKTLIQLNLIRKPPLSARELILKLEYCIHITMDIFN